MQAYPFRMTPENMAKHRNSPHMAFWKMIKQGYDHFEVTRQEPRVSVCERHYVFNAAAPGGAYKPLNFNPAGKCPAYEIPAAIAEAVNEKKREDEYKTAQLIAQGTPLAPSRSGIDGGMNATFAARLGVGDGGMVQDESGRSIMVSSASSGLTSRVGIVPPAPPPEAAPVATARAPAPRAAPVRQAATTPPKTLKDILKTADARSDNKPDARRTPQQSVGLRGSDTAEHNKAPAAKPEPTRAAQIVTAWPGAPKPQVLDKPAATTPTRSAYADSTPPAGAMTGAQAVLPASSFNSRWSAFR